MPEIHAHHRRQNAVGMKNRIIEKTGILARPRTILFDADHLWARFVGDDAASRAGYEIQHFTDDMELRRCYEYADPGIKALWIIDTPDMYIPQDIARQYYICRLSFQTIFPTLDADALRALPNIDYDLLSTCADIAALRPMTKEATERLCRQGMLSTEYARPYGQGLLSDAVAMAANVESHRDWNAIAQLFGRAAMIQHTIGALDDYEQKRTAIETAFVQWISTHYRMLSGTIDRARPILLSKAADFIRKGNSKIALIVMDGMSFENLYTIQQSLAAARLTLDIQSSFSFFPTVTSVARQSIFSGKLPREHDKPFSLDNEEKQWRAYWQASGYKPAEIYFGKTETPDVPLQAKIAGIVINICDDLMHAELQGLRGMAQRITEWMASGILPNLIRDLLARNFAVYMTSDHGNTSAIAQGRFTKPGLLAEPASRRAVIYKDYADAIELAKFTTMRYDNTYLPDGINTYLFGQDACYGDTGREYITHGGMTLEEAIVPFVRIGAYDG